jgi:hypothetical protein
MGICTIAMTFFFIVFFNYTFSDEKMECLDIGGDFNYEQMPCMDMFQKERELNK